MYKCIECGLEFDIKPDFCDCGNDVFEEIEIISTDSEPTVKEKHKKTFEEQYPMLYSFIQTLDPISVGIFIVCIILSIAALICIKPSTTEVADLAEPVKTVRKVADVNSFWNDTPPKIQKTNINNYQEPDITAKINDIISKVAEPQIEKKPQQPVKTTPQKTTVKPKPQNTVAKTTVNQPKKQNIPKVTTTNSNSVQKSSTAQKTTQPVNTPKQQPQQQVSQQNTKPIQNQQKTNQTQQSPQPVVQTTQNSNIAALQAQELKNFKNGLRNTLFSKINFMKVEGDGSCVVDFRIDASGRLVNKSFSKQSTNNTLNDEVYQAIMSTPSYKIPPSSYNGQVLHFSVKFQNSQYSVSLY